jgi:hypothetical protein
MSLTTLGLSVPPITLHSALLWRTGRAQGKETLGSGFQGVWLKVFRRSSRLTKIKTSGQVHSHRRPVWFFSVHLFAARKA